MDILIGQVLQFSASPFELPALDAVQISTQTALVISRGEITEIGAADAITAAYPDAPRTVYDDSHLICPGFVDAHAHYPQTAMIASWGKRLIDWLNTYTFPEEMRFGCMDRNAPDGLRDSAQSAYDDSKALLEEWHGKGRATYAITPRFSPALGRASRLPDADPFKRASGRDCMGARSLSKGAGLSGHL